MMLEVKDGKHNEFTNEGPGIKNTAKAWSNFSKNVITSSWR